jgi:hypothetical protein
MTKVINALWDYSKAIWMERNDAYHGADDQETQLKRSDDLNDLIVRSYQLDCHHQAVSRTPLYKRPIEYILSQPAKSRQSWLRSVDAALTGYCIRVPTDPTPFGREPLSQLDTDVYATKLSIRWYCITLYLYTCINN